MPGIGDYVKAGLDDFKKDPVTLAAGLFVGWLATAFTLTILAGPVMVGYMDVLRKIRKGEKASIGDIFGQINKDTILIWLVPFFAMVGVGIVVGILAGITGVPALAFLAQLAQIAIELAILWAFPMYVATRKPFMECLTGSLDFWKKNPIGNLIHAVVFWFIAFIGLVLCFLPGFVTVPIATACILHYYLDNAGHATAPTGAAPAV